MLGSLFKKTAGLAMGRKPAGAAGGTEEGGPSYMRTTRRASIHATLELLNPAKLVGKITSGSSAVLSPRSAAREAAAPPRGPGLKRTLTRKLTTSFATVAPSPEDIARANAEDLGEVVIEIVLATGLRKPTRVGTPAPSPFVKLAVRGNEQRTKKQERTLFPMWNERLVWKGKRGELCNPKMLVEVLAWDPLTPTTMGKGEVDLSPLLTLTLNPQTLTLALTLNLTLTLTLTRWTSPRS